MRAGCVGYTSNFATRIAHLSSAVRRLQSGMLIAYLHRWKLDTMNVHDFTCVGTLCSVAVSGSYVCASY